MSLKGRPKKPSEEKFIARTVRFHPRLWAEFAALVPAGQRSALIQRLLERELKQRRRQAANASSLQVTASVPGSADQDPWRRAAMAAQNYYETDPEAVAWAIFAGDTLDE